MRLSVFSTLLFITLWMANAQLQTRYERSDFKEAATYEEAMTFYKALDSLYDEVTIRQHGMTDIGIPLHVVMITNGESSIEEIHASGKAIWLINNAIHPGESDGVSASQMFARDILAGEKYQKVLDDVAIAIIPFYNIGGALNRNKTTRVNQNGPVEYGFRGNARHYDLNRDFIKSDTKNARAFQALFQIYDPDLLLDTHVSNGADYQHIMMLLSTQQDKMGGDLGNYLMDVLGPFCFEGMKTRGFDPVHYINSWGSTPDKGWPQFMDWPRYSTGYATLFHTLGYMSETHMLKTYQQRVESTYALMETMLDFLHQKGEQLVTLREKTKQDIANATNFEISWVLDTSKYTPITFKGYEPTYVESAISGLRRLKYDHSQPFTKEVKFRNFYEVNNQVVAPKYYIIPQQWTQVIDLMETNSVNFSRLESDTVLSVETY
ncbi:MAG: hypothetical protein HRT61_20135, partial [Ekhidna sp.]|nr:hypothetical protein [Ekhidna sp.]